MKKTRSIMVVFVLLTLLPAAAMAGSWEGTIQGFMCVTQGKVCPVGQEDPIAAAENIFVLLTPAGKHYFAANIERSTMARHINQKVKFDGKLNEKYNAITVTAAYAWKGNDWKKVWDVVWMRNAREALGMEPEE